MYLFLLWQINTYLLTYQYFCTNCLQGFTLESSRDEHYVYCIDNETVRVEMLKSGSTVEFYDGQNQFKVPFMMYVDFEAILKPIQGPRYRDMTLTYLLENWRRNLKI